MGLPVTDHEVMQFLLRAQPRFYHKGGQPQRGQSRPCVPPGIGVEDSPSCLRTGNGTAPRRGTAAAREQARRQAQPAGLLRRKKRREGPPAARFQFRRQGEDAAEAGIHIDVKITAHGVNQGEL